MTRTFSYLVYWVQLTCVYLSSTYRKPSMAPKTMNTNPATKHIVGPKAKADKKSWTYKRYRNGKLDLLNAPSHFKVL